MSKFNVVVNVEFVSGVWANSIEDAMKIAKENLDNVIGNCDLVIEEYADNVEVENYKMDCISARAVRNEE